MFVVLDLCLEWSLFMPFINFFRVLYTILKTEVSVDYSLKEIRMQALLSILFVLGLFWYIVLYWH